MQFIDTHIHLQDVMSSNATNIINTARKRGCAKMFCVSARESDWVKIETLSELFPKTIVPVFGIHPWHIQTCRQGWEDRLQILLQSHPQALIGEIGLDGLKPDIALQKQVFAVQLKLAQNLHRPAIIHAVKAVPLMDDFWSLLPQKFVFHGFNGKADFLHKILKFNGYIGVGFGLLKTPKAKEILSDIPENKLLLETDAPFGATYPWDIFDLIEQISVLCHKDKNALAQQIYQNSLEFLR